MLLALVLLSCEMSQQRSYVSFSGELNNFKDSTFSIKDLGYEKVIKVNENGIFKDSLKVLRPDLYTIETPDKKRAKVYLENSYDLYLTGDNDNFFTSFKYRGNDEGAQNNNFLISQFLYGSNSSSIEDLMVLEQEDFILETNQLKLGLDSIIKEFPLASKNLIEKTRDQNINYISKLKNNYPSLHQMYEDQKVISDRLAQGAESPKFFNLEDFKGGSKSLEDFKGKYVYMDIWATWCKPCIEEIPSIKKLSKEFKDHNITFVSISTDHARGSNGDWDAAREKWVKMVSRKQLTGTQLWAKDNFQEFESAFLIESIPRFILIDPEGKIVNSFAMRPSDPKISDYFKSLEI